MEKIPLWQMVRAAVETIGGVVSYHEIRQHILDSHGPISESLIAIQIVRSCVNVQARTLYPENQKPRLANTCGDFLFSVGSQRVALYNPLKHGVWEIRVDEAGKASVARISKGLPPGAAAAEDEKPISRMPGPLPQTRRTSSLIAPRKSRGPQ